MDDHSTHVGAGINIQGGEGNTGRQDSTFIATNSGELGTALGELRNAARLLPPEETELTRHLIEALSKEAMRGKPRRAIVTDLLRSISTVAATAGTAGAAVIDAVQAVQRAISS